MAFHLASSSVLLKHLACSLCDKEASAAMRAVNRKMSVTFNPKKKVPSGDECGYCGSADQGDLKLCSCRLVRYCSKACQASHWKAKPGHSERCIAPADRKPSAFQPKEAKHETDSSQDLCGVCFEPLLPENVLESGTPPHAGTQTLICKHSFHLKCASDLESFSSSTHLCTLCRGPFSNMPTETLFLDAKKALDVIPLMVEKGQIS
jgi:hypothetical protein